MTYQEIRACVQEANLVLVGIGEELSGDLSGFYASLEELLLNKDYFIVTLLDREGPETAGLIPEQITAPLSEGEAPESWERYLHWLGFTLNQKLCILELGAGFSHPELIRFPFEKTCYFNQKSKFIRISAHFPQLSAEIAGRGASVREDPAKFFAEETGRQEEKE